MLFVLPEVGLVVAQRPSSKHGGMCLLVAQTMASDLLLGGGVHEDYFPTFSLKGALYCLSPPLCYCNICPQARGCFHGYISSPCCSSSRRVFFFTLPKNYVAFCRRRRPDGVCLPTCTSSAPVTYLGAALINKPYSQFMLIVSIT